MGSRRTQDTEVTTNRLYKARLFEMVFSQRTELLQLYNAMNGTDYQDPDELEINTLQNAIYIRQSQKMRTCMEQSR